MGKNNFKKHFYIKNSRDEIEIIFKISKQQYKIINDELT